MALSRRPTAVLLVTLVTLLAGVLGWASPASAVIAGADFPTRSEAKRILDGVGRWQSWTAPVEAPLRVRPARCDLADRLADAVESRQRGFFGRVAGLPPTVHGQANVKVYRFASQDGAKAALRAVRSFGRDCPQSTEIFCEDCDGIVTTWRRPMRAPVVGDASVAWRVREASLGLARGHVVTARDGRTLVLTTVLRLRDPGAEPFTYPKAPPKQQVLRLARLAVARAA
jgi:hypothetical protein